MDHRTILTAGTVLPFPGMQCVIQTCVGRGSNAIVYEGSYADALHENLRHRILLKELFPYDAEGHIWRDGSQKICRDAQGEALWEVHRRSYERGNRIHLQLLDLQPDQIGGNLNTFRMNQTLYTVLDFSGGRSLDRELTRSRTAGLPTIVSRIRKLLYALNIFHSSGFLHLDISTDNVLLVGEGDQERVLLIDYNSVHTRKEIQEEEDFYFSAKNGFSAPEARIGLREQISPGTDLFSVAAVFYACLTGYPLTTAQLTRRRPPDLSELPLMQPEPSTVKLQLKKIMYRGLHALPERRYQSCGEMLEDLQELENRIAGVGVTHAALWEVGRKSVQSLIRQNPSLSYLQKEEELYPLRICPEGSGAVPAGQFMSTLAESGGQAVMLLGEGGSGKSTVLLHTIFSSSSRYSPLAPAAVYLPLFGWKQGQSHSILDSVLMELRFDRKTRTMEDARHALSELLGQPLSGQGRRAVLLLLLDGLNEASGDCSELLEEIGALSALPGLCMVITGRTAPDRLRLRQVRMLPLEAGDVERALSEHGLLMPENEQMQQLLRTPMMLSLFLQAAANRNRQLFCQSQEELVEAYLQALCEKTAGAGEPSAYAQADAAVRFVLPVIAGEIARYGGPLDDQALLKGVSRCYSVFRFGTLSKAFPEWIGHSRDILGGAGHAEEWYGQMVHQLLWRKLGLLVKDENGRYSLPHQILQEYMLEKRENNNRRLKVRNIRFGAGLLSLLIAAVCVSIVVYELFLKPEPYDETMCEILLSASVIQYVNYGIQNGSMKELLNDQAEPEQCMREVSLRGMSASSSSKAALENLSEGTGDVVSWSRQPVDFENAAVLLDFPEERSIRYLQLIRAYELVEAGKAGVSLSEFSEALLALLEADADIAWILNQMVFEPHYDGMDDQQRASFETAFLSLPAEQESRSVDLSRGAAYALEKAYEKQREAENQLNQMAVMYDPYVEEGVS